MHLVDINARNSSTQAYTTP